MPDGFPIRNIHIEDKHPTVIAGEVLTRKMTPEEWEKYGPKLDKKRRNIMNIPREVETVKKKLDIPAIIQMAKKHSLSKEGREVIAQEYGITRVDVTNFINRGYVKKALIESGLVMAEENKANDSKKKLVKDIAKALDVTPKIQVNENHHEIKIPPKPSTLLHMNLCANLHETYVAKNTAYSDSFSATFREFGIISALTRMSDKWNRIKALAKGAKNDVKDESLEDSLMDMASDCVMTVMELRGGEK